MSALFGKEEGGNQRLCEPEGGYTHVPECDGAKRVLGVPDDQRPNVAGVGGTAGTAGIS
jgi:hypothetical protein